MIRSLSACMNSYRSSQSAAYDLSAATCNAYPSSKWLVSPTNIKHSTNARDPIPKLQIEVRLDTDMDRLQ